MNRKTIGKLRSQTGASLSFALLLFLVCAVLCSVILVSATTAAGRMSKIAETDQRYYAVTSAAELLKELINRKTVTIEKVTEDRRIEVYLDGELVSSSIEHDYNGDSEIYMIGPDTADPSEVEAYPTFSSIPEDAAYKYYAIMENILSAPQTASFTLAASDELKNALGNIDPQSGTLIDPLGVPINESVAANGDITLTVGDKYIIELTFSASVNGPTVSEAEGASDTKVESDTKYQIETDMTKTETTTLTWTLTGIKTFA